MEPICTLFTERTNSGCSSEHKVQYTQAAEALNIKTDLMCDPSSAVNDSLVHVIPRTNTAIHIDFKNQKPDQNDEQTQLCRMLRINNTQRRACGSLLRMIFIPAQLICVVKWLGS